jgi:uncharacterized protein YkwD
MLDTSSAGTRRRVSDCATQCGRSDRSGLYAPADAGGVNTRSVLLRSSAKGSPSASDVTARFRPSGRRGTTDSEGFPLCRGRIVLIHRRYSGPFRWLFIAAAATALLVAGNAAGGVAAAGSTTVVAVPQAVRGAQTITQMPTLEDSLVTAINELRQQHGLSALRLNPELAEAARVHSLSMAERGYFEHSSPAGSPFWYRIQSKYSAHHRRYWRVGENLAWASPSMSAQLAIQLWMNSPPHRSVLLRPGWREIGVGGVHVRPGPGVYRGLPATIVTADFGVRG